MHVYMRPQPVPPLAPSHIHMYMRTHSTPVSAIDPLDAADMAPASDPTIDTILARGGVAWRFQQGTMLH